MTFATFKFWDSKKLERVEATLADNKVRRSAWNTEDLITCSTLSAHLTFSYPKIHDLCKIISRSQIESMCSRSLIPIANSNLVNWETVEGYAMRRAKCDPKVSSQCSMSDFLGLKISWDENILGTLVSREHVFRFTTWWINVIQTIEELL